MAHVGNGAIDCRSDMWATHLTHTKDKTPFAEGTRNKSVPWTCTEFVVGLFSLSHICRC
jgi:hypothetical protein